MHGIKAIRAINNANWKENVHNCMPEQQWYIKVSVHKVLHLVFFLFEAYNCLKMSG